MNNYFIEDKRLKDKGFNIYYDPEKDNLVCLLANLLKENGRNDSYSTKGIFNKYDLLGIYMSKEDLERSKATKTVDKIKSKIRRHLHNNDPGLEERVLKVLKNGDNHFNYPRNVCRIFNPLVNRRITEE